MQRPVSMIHASPVPPLPRSRREALMRQATAGAMSGALMHDVAGIIQGIGGAIMELTELAEQRQDPELLARIEELRDAGDDAVELFVAMRKYVRDGAATVRAVAADEIVRRVTRQVGGVVRERGELRVAAAPGVRVRAAEQLLVHVLGAVVRNAAAATPAGGAVDIAIEADGDDVRFVVTDDGPGVPDEIVATMFEPCVWQRPDGAGTGLAIAAHSLAAQGGTIAYHRAPGRGACFTIRLAQAR